MNERLEKLFQAAALGKDEAVLIHKPSNMFYLSGYTGEGLIAAGRGFQAIITDFRYTEQAERQAPGFDVMMIEKKITHASLAGQLFANGADAAVAQVVDVVDLSFRVDQLNEVFDDFYNVFFCQDADVGGGVQTEFVVDTVAAYFAQIVAAF